MKTEMADIIIYTDGSCIGNPGAGGWAALIIEDGIERYHSGGEVDTTNNRMELTAAIKALHSLPQAKNISLFTDSEYLRKGVTEWMTAWKARNWKRKGGALANIDLWQALDAELSRHKVTWHWVKGHQGNHRNELVDRLARQAALKS